MMAEAIHTSIDDVFDMAMILHYGSYTNSIYYLKRPCDQPLLLDTGKGVTAFR